MQWEINYKPYERASKSVQHGKRTRTNERDEKTHIRYFNPRNVASLWKSPICSAILMIFRVDILLTNETI